MEERKEYSVRKENFHPLHYGLLVIRSGEKQYVVAHPTPKSKLVTCPIADKSSWWVVGEFRERRSDGALRVKGMETSEVKKVAEELTLASAFGKLPGVLPGTQFRPYEQVWDGYGGKGNKKLLKSVLKKR